MTIDQYLRLAFRALGVNKLRTALTMLGILVGVAAVVAMLAIGNGARLMVTSQITAMGSNLLFVRPGATTQGGVRGATTANTLTMEDADAMSDPNLAPSVAEVAPEVSSFVQIVANGQNWNTRAVGTNEHYQNVRNAAVESGEFINESEVQARSAVVVLGPTVANTLFPDSDPIDQPVRVNAGSRTGMNMRVVGVLQAKGGTGFGSQDDMIIMPLTTMQTRLMASRTSGGGRTVSVINVQAVDEASINSAITEISELLRDRHRVSQDDFSIQSQADTLAAANQVTGVLTILLGSIAGISLLVGGIGIMNIMLVSVRERTREIGLRKAVGARRRDILIQFLVESITVSLLGGAEGVLVSMGLTRAVGSVSLGGQQLSATVSGDAIILAVGVSVAIGVISGLYPAWQAAHLNPIDAIHFE